MLRHAAEAERVLYPCHNYKHAPVIKAVRGVLEAGRIGKVHLVTLQTFRNTHAKGVTGWRPDWRRERSYSGGGIAMDHGSHTFYLAFEWLGGYPTAITRARGDAGAVRHRGRLHLQPALPDRRRVGAPVAGTPACARCSTRCTASAARSASRTTTSRWRRELRAGGDRPGHDLDASSGRRSRRTGWTPATSTWFNSLFDEFKGAIDRARVRGARGARRRSCACSSSRPRTPRRATAAASCRSPGWPRWPATTSIATGILRKDGASRV